MYSQIGSLGNMDGLNLNYRYSIGDSLAKVNLAYGQSDIRNDESAGKFRSQYKKLATINFEIQGDDWRVQSAYMSARLGGIIFPNSDLIRASLSQSPPILQPFYQSISDAFLPEDEPVSYFSIGGRYMFDNWELLAEYGDYSSDFALSRGTRSGYVSAGYYINDFVPYVIFAKNKNKNVDDIIDIEALQNVLPPQLVGLLIPEATLVNQTASNNHVDQESISVGLRWDINSAYAFKIEINHYRLGDSGSGLFSFASAGEPNPAQSFNVISAGFTTTF
jgi:predicted porin